MESDVRSFKDASALAGEELRRAREARSLSIVDVARQIHLSTSQVRDLEQGRAESFHNAQVRRRLGGRYCDFLELPRSLVADSPRPDFPLFLPGTPVRARPAGSRQGYGPWLLGGLIAIVGVLAVQAGWQWWGSNTRDLASASPPASSASVPQSVPPSVAPSVPSADPAMAPAPAPIPLTGPAPSPVPASAMRAPAQARGIADGAGVTEAGSKPGDTPPAMSATGTLPLHAAAPPSVSGATPAVIPPGASSVVNRAVVPPAASAGRLQISAKGDRCWIEILHDQGRTARVLQPGQVIDLPAVGLHKVFVGNVRAITATLNGQPLDLRPTGGVTARYDAP